MTYALPYGRASALSRGQVSFEGEGAEGGVELRLEACAFVGGGLLLPGELFEARLLLVCLLDVAGDELARLGRLGERLDVLAQALLVGADLGDLAVDGRDARLRGGHARLQVEDVLERGARRLVDVAAREEELYLVGRHVRERICL